MRRRILIADDHSAIRRGLRNILEAQFASVEFGETISAYDTLQKLKEDRWDLLILDIEVPGRNGFDVLKQMKLESIKTPVLVFSFYPEDQIAVRTLKAGAAGYVPKDASDTILTGAIHQVLNGKRYVSPYVAQQLALHVQSPEPEEPISVLSDREYQTLLLIASGKTVSEIAEVLTLSISTISTYRSRILQKMGMKTNAELTSYVIKRKLI